MEDIQFEKKTYPLQISVDDAEVMHILQAICNVNQLNNASAWILRGQVTTYKLSAICVPIPLNEPTDVSVFHPLGN